MGEDSDLRWAWLPLLAVLGALLFVFGREHDVPEPRGDRIAEPSAWDGPARGEPDAPPSSGLEDGAEGDGPEEDEQPFVGELDVADRESVSSALDTREGVAVELFGAARDDTHAFVVFGLNPVDRWQAQHERAGDWDQLEARIEAAQRACRDEVSEQAARLAAETESACARAEESGSEADRVECDDLESQGLDVAPDSGWMCDDSGFDEVYGGSVQRANQCGQQTEMFIAGAEQLAPGAWRIEWTRPLVSAGDGCPALVSIEVIEGQAAAITQIDWLEDHGVDNQRLCGRGRRLHLVAPSGTSGVEAELVPSYEEIDDGCDPAPGIFAMRVLLDAADGLRLTTERHELDVERCDCEDAQRLAVDEREGLFSDHGVDCDPLHEADGEAEPCGPATLTRRESRYDPETGWSALE